MNRLLTWSSIVCLGVAVIGASVYFRSRTASETRHLFLPIEVFNLPIALTFAAPPPKGVSLAVQGPAGVVRRLAEKRLTYPLDLSEASAGANLVSVTTGALNLPPELTGAEVHPKEMMIRLETAAVKNVPVAVNLIGQPAAGFTVVDTLVTPPAVTVSGPASLVAPVDRIMTQPIPIEGLSESFRKETAVVLPETMVLRASKKTATVEIRITEKIDVRKFEGVPVRTPPSPYAAVIAPKSITMEIRGPVRVLDRLTFSDASTDTGNVAIDTSGLKPGVYLLRAAIQLPVETTLVSAAPDFFTITVSAPPETPAKGRKPAAQ